MAWWHRWHCVFLLRYLGHVIVTRAVLDYMILMIHHDVFILAET